eukprot:CAMPEP_0185185264 /NCGR_PEP_ID=MMETSP1140-20130426/3163_1 /TAXON_ID=298111 /ORGANISM="Pavlova sp., Strain CCMP459" /LENGTH=181 /DNA_ID=CAMNT_0027751423 /DNA_START=78 /DNA_END=624 /DNA_ORIENTATION=+
MTPHRYPLRLSDMDAGNARNPQPRMDIGVRSRRSDPRSRRAAARGRTAEREKDELSTSPPGPPAAQREPLALGAASQQLAYFAAGEIQAEAVRYEFDNRYCGIMCSSSCRARARSRESGHLPCTAEVCGAALECLALTCALVPPGARLSHERRPVCWFAVATPKKWNAAAAARWGWQMWDH